MVTPYLFLEHPYNLLLNAILLPTPPSIPAEYDDNEEYKEYEEERENTYLEQVEQELINLKKSLTISDDQLCIAQQHNLTLETKLDDMHQLLIEQELDLQNEMTKLNNIMKKILYAKTLGEAKDSLCDELWGISFKNIVQSLKM